jgi:protoheme IX farnesyltransferase
MKPGASWSSIALRVSPGTEEPRMSAFSTTPSLISAARGRARVRDYVALTRPRVLTLVLFTAPPAMVMGSGKWPEFSVLLGVLVGSAMIGGGCGALNAWWERDRDAVMARTADRPLPTGRLTPLQALVFGLVVSTLGLAVLYAAGGALPAAIAAGTLAHYFFIYTLWLKPRSPQNIVIGGAAGAATPLIADAAADGRLGVWGVVLFAIVLLWTPAHFWAIALYRKSEYEAAGFPMMPSVVGNDATRRRQLVYALLLIPVTLIPWFAGVLGVFYAVVALVAGLAFCASIGQAMRRRSDAADRRVFRVSILYLVAIFAAMLVELAFR